MKRFLSAVLAVSILVSGLFIVPVTAAYENTYSNTGNQIADLIGVATTQLGYKEGNSSSQLSGTVAGSGNYTKYGQWYGVNPGAWCAMFVSWCANQAGISTSVVPKHSSCDVGMNWFKNKGRWGWAKYWANQKGYTVYTPVAGDIIYFGTGNLNDSTHVGIVYQVDSSYVYTIEGNKSNQCKRVSYSLGSSYIYGYGHPSYSGSSSGGSTATTAPVAPSGESSMSLSSATYPTTLSVGQSFSISGTLTSNYPISWVRASCWNTAGS